VWNAQSFTLLLKNWYRPFTKSHESQDPAPFSDSASRFEWQKRYGAFPVSYSQIELVRRYIQNQREHHRTKTFEEEYIAFLKLHNIEFDYEYLFEAEH